MPTRRLLRSARSERNPEDGGARTRAGILEAAGEVFAEKGFDRATGKEIAERAGVNAAAVNYYYRGTEGLYAEVQAEAHRRLLVYDELLALASGPGTPADRLRAVIERLGRAIMSPAASTWPLRVLSREILSPSSASHLLRERELRPKGRVLFGLIGEILALPPNHPAVARCFLNIIAPLVMALLLGQRSPGRGETPLGSSQSEPEEMIAHFQRFALGGLSAVARGVRADQANRPIKRPRRRSGGKEA